METGLGRHFDVEIHRELGIASERPPGSSTGILSVDANRLIVRVHVHFDPGEAFFRFLL